jgi:hypothetical protein
MVSQRLQVMVSVDDRHLGDMGRVADDLRVAGLDVERTLEGIGVITGTVASDDVGRLAPIEGVSHIEEQREVRASDSRVA